MWNNQQLQMDMKMKKPEKKSMPKISKKVWKIIFLLLGFGVAGFIGYLIGNEDTHDDIEDAGEKVSEIGERIGEWGKDVGKSTKKLFD